MIHALPVAAPALILIPLQLMIHATLWGQRRKTGAHCSAKTPRLVFSLKVFKNVLRKEFIPFGSSAKMLKHPAAVWRK